jgi:hypothetical protein
LFYNIIVNLTALERQRKEKEERERESLTAMLQKGGVSLTAMLLKGRGVSLTAISSVRLRKVSFILSNCASLKLFHFKNVKPNNRSKQDGLIIYKTTPRGL